MSKIKNDANLKNMLKVYPLTVLVNKLFLVILKLEIYDEDGINVCC